MNIENQKKINKTLNSLEDLAAELFDIIDKINSEEFEDMQQLYDELELQEGAVSEILKKLKE